MTFDVVAAAKGEKAAVVELDDARLARSWPGGLSRIVLTLPGPPTTADVILTVTR